MTPPMPIRSGTCSECGRALVQIVADDRTYHPFAVIRGRDCAALLPIEGTDMQSHDVPADNFIPDPA